MKLFEEIFRMQAELFKTSRFRSARMTIEEWYMHLRHSFGRIRHENQSHRFMIYGHKQ